MKNACLMNLSLSGWLINRYRLFPSLLLWLFIPVIPIYSSLAFPFRLYFPTSCWSGSWRGNFSRSNWTASHLLSERTGKEKQKKEQWQTSVFLIKLQLNAFHAVNICVFNTSLLESPKHTVLHFYSQSVCVCVCVRPWLCQNMAMRVKLLIQWLLLCFT